ncbi:MULTISPECIES: hypothetical protein [Streptomyces]|uniref:hypothetical protein n=1 Tax=Streptomyces TaxID=1883 RepID=UPI0033BF4ECD
MVVETCLSWKLQLCADGLESAYFVHPVELGLVQLKALFAQAAPEAWGHAVVNMSQNPARPHVKSTSVMNKGG